VWEVAFGTVPLKVISNTSDSPRRHKPVPRSSVTRVCQRYEIYILLTSVGLLVCHGSAVAHKREQSEVIMKCLSSSRIVLIKARGGVRVPRLSDMAKVYLSSYVGRQPEMDGYRRKTVSC